jgi:hypothetical protein
MAPIAPPAPSGDAELASLWIGDRLSPIEQISALSFLEQGHRLSLYVTGPLRGVPPGVQLRDAREVLPLPDIVRHRKTRSPALHSDLFRYALLDKTGATWVDLDLVALRPIDLASPYLIGWESENWINGAVLRLPRESPTLRQLLRYDAAYVGYPPHLGRFRRWKYVARSLGRGLPITKWPWGSLGPRALTHHMRENGEAVHALPVQAFYPVPMAKVDWLLLPGRLQRSSFGPESMAVHVWGSHLRRLARSAFAGRIDPSSFLGLEARRLSGRFGFDIALTLD